MVANNQAEQKSPVKILGSAIRYLRETHKNNYSWNLTISDEDAIDILSNLIAAL